MTSNSLTILGPTKLQGEIKIHGAKNAILPTIISSIVSNKDVILENVPDIGDVNNIIQVLNFLNVKIDRDLQKETLTINASDIKYCDLNQKFVSNTRAVIWLIAPLLIRFHKVNITYPGGCPLNKGARKIDLHVKVLERMGAKFDITSGCIYASCASRLRSTKFRFNKVSVGATITAIIAGCFAKGTSYFSGCALEPEIVNLCNLLISCGCNIKGVGTSNLVIYGVDHKKLNSTKHSIIPDRIEAGTYIIAAGITKGSLILNNIKYSFLSNLIEFFSDIGIEIKDLGNKKISVKGKKISAIGVQTNPYPLFPTDLQPQLVSLLCFADGVSSIKENIYDNRLAPHINQLHKMGAKIDLMNHNIANIFGIKNRTLLGYKDLHAKDLRCGMSLLLSSMAAHGVSIIHNAKVINRGYNNAIKMLNACGANITINH